MSEKSDLLPRARDARLRRELNVWQAIGFSLAFMTPSGAININPQATAGAVGRAVPLAMAMAMVGVLLIAYTFARLCQRFDHAGSVYGFVGSTLGPRSGVLAGWALLGTYTLFGVVSFTVFGIFGATVLNSLGIWTQQPSWSAFLIGTIVLLAAFVLAIAPVRGATRLLVSIEGVTIALILIVTTVILVRLLSGTAPQGHTVDLTVFTVEPATGLSAVFLGVVFGFLSLVGFEAAATLGEEARMPRRDIPRAILGTAIFGGLFFVFVTAVAMMAFGTGDAGVAAFTGSSSLLGDLGSQYLATWVGDVITIGAAVGAFASGLACLVGASRLLFALARDGVGPAVLAEVCPTRGVPMRATVAIATGIMLVIGAVWVVLRVRPFDLFIALGTSGTLILLVAYALATIGAMKLLFLSGRREVAAWEVVIPALALLLIGYTLIRNTWPYPTGAAGLYPALSALWLLLGVVWVLARSVATRHPDRLLIAEDRPDPTVLAGVRNRGP